MCLEEQVVMTLSQKQFTITTAESCTGGLLASTILNVPGASAIFGEGYITYSNDAKHRLLGVSKETLLQYGAVSEETAKEMAMGAALKANANAALCATGIAGPGGGTKEKPVGLIYVGCYLEGKLAVKKLLLKGTREENRRKTVEEALKLLLEEMNFVEK